MTALDEIQKATRKLAALSQEGQPPSYEEVLEAIDNLRKNISAFIAEVRQLYRAAILLTSNFKSASLAAEVWKDLHADFAAVLVVLERLPNLDPKGLDQLIEDSRNTVRKIVEQADQEYRSYSETAYLLGSPANAERLREAIEETQSGSLPVYESAEDLLKSLHQK